MCPSVSWWRLSGGRCFHQASRFHTKLVPADPVWSPAHATLDNQKGNILEPFPLSYCVCIRFLLTLSLIFRGGLLCYLNKTHGTCVCFFFFFLQLGSEPFPLTGCLSWLPETLSLALRGGQRFLLCSRDEASRAGVPPSCSSHTGSPTLIVSASQVV